MQKKLAASGSGWLLLDLALFAAAFALYAASASSALGWLDSPELVAASVTLGVPHSPGHPLPVFLGAAAALVPVGDLALRVNLAAAAAGAAACALVGACARDVIRRAAPELSDRARAALGAAAALVLAASWAAWSQSVRAEVYALAAALSIAGLSAALAWDRGRDPRWLVAAGLAGGLALATHHLIAVLVLVPAGVFVLARRQGRRPTAPLAALTALAGIAGLAAFLYLPVRSAAPRAPELDWGAPHEASRFAWTVSGAMFAGTASAEHASTRGQDVAEAVWAAGAAASAPLALLAVLGALAALSRREARSAGCLLLAIAAAGVAARAVLGFDPETSDHHGYLVPAMAALVLLAAAGAAVLASAAGATGTAARGAARRPLDVLAAGPRASRAALVLATAGLALAVVRAVLGWSAAAAPSAEASDLLARRELEPLPPGALLLTSYFQTSARLIALRAVEGTRPDVDVLHRGLLTLPGAREAARRRHPSLAALIDAPLAAGLPTPIAALADLAAGRAVLVELDPDLDPPVQPHLIPAGRFARFAAVPPDPAARGAAEADDSRARAGLDEVVSRASGTDRADAVAALLWLDFCRLEHACALGRRGAAEEALRRAWALSPGDVMLEERAARCHLEAPAVPR